MPEGPDDDIVAISASGGAEPIGATAALRLSSRAGRYRVLVGPPDVLVLARMAEGGVEPRSCALSGEVRAGGLLCDVLSFLASTGRRGELVVHDDQGASRSIFFDRGLIVGAHSTALRDRLGEVLYRNGILTRDGLMAADEATVSGHARFGEAAVKLGLVTRETLFRLMARQIEEIFYALLLVENGTFYFLDGFDEAALSSRHALQPGTLAREGIRRMHETRYFRNRIPSDRHVPKRDDSRGAPDADPLGAYAAIDGLRSVGDLCRVLQAGEFEVTRAIFQLVQSRHVTIEQPRLTAAEIVGVYNRTITLVLRELDALDEGDAVRQELAAFAKERGYDPLLEGAGPSDDGALDPPRVVANAAKSIDRAELEDRLAERLLELASYALFLARPHVARAAIAGRPTLSMRVKDILNPISSSSERRDASNTK